MKIRYGLFFQWPILHKTPLAGGVWAVSGGVWMVSGMYLFKTFKTRKLQHFWNALDVNFLMVYPV